MNPPESQRPTPPESQRPHPAPRKFEGQHISYEVVPAPSDKFLLHTFIIVGFLAAVVAVVLLVILIDRPDGNLCNGADYDFALCQVQRVQTCQALEVLTRQECIDLLGGK